MSPMTWVTHILAAGSGGGGGIVVSAIVVFIWIIIAIANAANKQKEEARRKQIRRQLGTPIPPVILAPQIQMRVPREAPRRQQPQQPQQQPRRGKPTGRVVQQSVARPVPPPVPIQSPIAARAPVPISETTTTAAHAQTIAVNAAALHRWLRPETLRHQFFVTEVLQPPVALRPERGQSWM